MCVCGSLGRRLNPPPSPRRNTPMAIIAGHEQRVSRIAFHPSGDYLASTWCVLQSFAQTKHHRRSSHKTCFPDPHLSLTTRKP